MAQQGFYDQELQFTKAVNACIIRPMLSAVKLQGQEPASLERGLLAARVRIPMQCRQDLHHR